MSLQERERPSHFSVYRDAAFLSRCNPSEAHNLLKKRNISFSSVFGTPETPPDSHVLEYILYRRNDYLIDLSLAEHGRSGSVLERVYERGDAPTRIVACGNPSLFVGDTKGRSRLFDESEVLLWKIVRHGPLSELRAVCENPHITSGFYASLVSSWRGDEDSKIDAKNRLSDERFKKILHFLSRNPRITMKREESEERYYLDGFSHYRYNEFFVKCWELAKIVPVDFEWAHALSQLYSRLHRPYDMFDDIDAVLARWRLEDENPFSPTVSLREEIAVKFLKPTIGMLNSDDPAIRFAFFRTFDPEDLSVRDHDWIEWLKRDDMCYIYLQQNENIWRSPRGRSNLRALLWHKSRRNSDITDVGFFDRREEEHRKKNPEWFKSDEDFNNEDVAREPNRIDDLERSIRSLVETLAKRRGADAIWLLAAALIGSFIGASVW